MYLTLIPSVKYTVGTMTKITTNASALGKLGGVARAKKLTKKQLSEIGKKGAEARWGIDKKPTHTPNVENA